MFERSSCARRALLAAFVLTLGTACASQEPRGKMDRAEERGKAAERALSTAEEGLDRLDLETAGGALETAAQALGDTAIQGYPDRDFLRERLERARARFGEVQKEIERRELERAVSMRRSAVEAASRRFEEAFDALEKKGEGTEEEVRGVENIRKAALQTIEEGRPLEPKDAGYAGLAEKEGKMLEAAEKEIAAIYAVITFKKGPLADAAAAETLLGRAKRTKGREAQGGLFDEARGKLEACVQTATKILEISPRIAGTRLDGDRRALTPKKVLAMCERELRALDKKTKGSSRKKRGRR